MNWICKIFGHIGWPQSLTQLIPSYFSSFEEKNEEDKRLCSFKCQRCGKRPIDLID